jgi:DNA-directed RNA polymerase subunit H (RpoH/RPB5)
MNAELYTVYKNLIICLTKYRGYKLLGDELQQNNFHQQFVKGALMFNAIKQSGRKVVIFLIAEGDYGYINKSPKYKQLVTKIMVSRAKDDKITYHPQDYIFVTKEPFSNNIQKEMLEAKKKGQIFIERCLFMHFIIEKPLHVVWCKHEIATDEEIELIESLHKIKRDYLPKIAMSDNGVVWTGARPGQVLKIHRRSETTGTAIGYRVVRS